MAQFDILKDENHAKFHNVCRNREITIKNFYNFVRVYNTTILNVFF